MKKIKEFFMGKKEPQSEQKKEPLRKFFNPYPYEILRCSLYDRVNLGSVISDEVDFFTNPVGSNATLIRYSSVGSCIKTYRDTNLPSFGSDPNKDYAIYGVAISIIPITHDVDKVEKDIYTIRKNGVLVVKVAGELILRRPLSHIPLVGEELPWDDLILYYYPITNKEGKPWILHHGDMIQAAILFNGIHKLKQNNDILIAFETDVKRPS